MKTTPRIKKDSATHETASGPNSHVLLPFRSIDSQDASPKFATPDLGFDGEIRSSRET